MNKKKTAVGIVFLLIVISVAVTLIIGLSSNKKTPEEMLLKKPGKTVLYFSPHQDDEFITMGIDVATTVKNGYDVHIILCTDGSICNVREKLNNGKHCKICGADHNYEMSQKEFALSRDAEFVDSCLALGVEKENIHIEETRMVDGSETVDGTKEIIKKYLGIYGKSCTVCAIYPNDEDIQHRDHHALGIAATELKDEGIIKHLYLFEEPYITVKVKHENGTQPYIFRAPDDILESLQNSVDAYKKWEPESKRFAVGYHSAHQRMENVLTYKLLYYHIYQ